MKRAINGNWRLYRDDGMEVPAHVPGDITADLYRAGRIADPFFGLEHKKLGWILQTDFTYEASFDVDEDIWNCEDICLVFDGIDLFAEISLNGEPLGTTENMFLQYRYSVKERLQRKHNILKVRMLSTKRKMSEIDTEDYWGIFNDERLFIRKAQCHFGWDWAPDMPGYGICKPVWLTGENRHRVSDVSVRAYNDGALCIVTELNYDVRPMTDRYGKPMEIIPDEVKHDRLVYKVSCRPQISWNRELSDSEEYLIYEQQVQSNRNFVNFKIESPQLWWPSGYGGQPMYAYCVELIRDGKILDCRTGSFAFREVCMEQRPVTAERLECKFVVNGMPIFAKGSNWVPMECFTGEMRRKKYEKLLSLAKDGNLNMLRVWGGGIYENDDFYDICDRLGIMVWQDMMFSCADIPEEKPAFIEMMKKEIDYQIRRLRQHPSIVLWSGGNEKVGSVCKQISHGDFFVDVILPGMIRNLDESRPVVKQSPFGMTELANDMTSGDSHISAYEAGLEKGIDKYRDFVSANMASFVSECTVMGPASLSCYKKMLPEDKLWPMNEYWDDRLADNPYAVVRMSFARKQKLYADSMYGTCRSVEDFICKGMTVHAELLRAECEYARHNKGNTWGFMNWMYSDTWPSGSLSLVDYYGEPKQVYYQMKRSFAPLLVTFVQNSEGQTVLSIVNDLPQEVSGGLVYGRKSLDGAICWSNAVQVSVSANGRISMAITEDDNQEDSYLYVKGSLNGQELSNVYSSKMWTNCRFESDYDYSVCEESGGLIVTVRAHRFAKGVTLLLPENEKFVYSDNYFDLEAGDEKTVYISGAASKGELRVTDFAHSGVSYVMA